LGGISLRRSEGVDKVLQGTPAAFATKLLNFSNTKGWVIARLGPESYPSCRFVNQIWEFTELAPLEAPEHPVSRPGPWSAEEREKLRELILAREQNFA
jgi:hypothetical protein